MRFVHAFETAIILFFRNLFAQSPAGFALSLDGDYPDFDNVHQINFGLSDFAHNFCVIKSSTRLETIIGKREIYDQQSFWI